MTSHTSQTKPLPSVDELRRLFSYDPETGLLRWKWRTELADRVNNRMVGRTITTRGDRGYIIVHINGTRYRAHRIIWKLCYGYEAPELDHRDGNTGNNRLTNLREAAHHENVCNARRWDGKALPKGVRKNWNKYEARIRRDGVLRYLGLFDTPELAHAAYRIAADELHGKFARHD